MGGGHRLAPPGRSGAARPRGRARPRLVAGDREAAGVTAQGLVTVIPPRALALLSAAARAQARQLILDLTAQAGMAAVDATEACTVVPVPAALLDPRPGLAVLHHARGRTAVYCADDQITQDASDRLAVFASRAAGLLGRPGPACGGPAVRVVRLGHGEFGDLHLGVAVTRGGHVTTFVCRGPITAGPAEALGVLWQGLCKVPDVPRWGRPADGGTWLLSQGCGPRL